LFCFKLIPQKERLHASLAGAVLHRQIQSSVVTTDHPRPVAESVHQNKRSESLQNQRQTAQREQAMIGQGQDAPP